MTMTQKILAARAGLDYVYPGQFIEADLDVVLINDITGPVAINEFSRMGVEGVFDKEKIVMTPDHFTPNKDVKAAGQAKMLRDFARAQGIVNYFEVGRVGIEHVFLPEQGLVTAGDVVIGADSHTCTYGALGAFSTGVGSTDAAAGMATGRAWFRVPAAMRFELAGKLPPWVSGKDVILHIIGRIGVGGALYKSMEFTGPGIAALSMDDRFTIANMAVEAGAKNGIFPVDEKTLEYIAAHPAKPGVFPGDVKTLEYIATHPAANHGDGTFDSNHGDGPFDRGTGSGDGSAVPSDVSPKTPTIYEADPDAVKTKSGDKPLRDNAPRNSPMIYEADPDAEYLSTLSVDMSALRPTVSFPSLPDNTRTIDEAKGIRIDQSFIGSCTNGRLSDMEVTARILKGRKVADGVRCIIIPATQEIYLACVRNGWAEIFVEAGAVFSTPTCGPCLGGHMGILAEGEKAIATTNRNFVGRMGHVDSEVYLSSPAVAAASAVTGVITDPAEL